MQKEPRAKKPSKKRSLNKHSKLSSMSTTALENASKIKLMKMNESLKLAVNSTEHRDIYSEGNEGTYNLDADGNTCVLGDNVISTFVEPCINILINLIKLES